MVSLNSPSYSRGLKVSIPLLKTCRQIYSEGIKFLYSSNHFKISSRARGKFLLPYLPQLVLPQRLRHIRHLHISWDLISCFASTGRAIPDIYLVGAWESLSLMKGLRVLKVEWKLEHIQPGFLNLWHHRKGWVFEHIKTITAPAMFELILPFSFCPLDIYVGDSNCVVRATFGPENRH
ncbi:hypothetical protein P154DRAFT_522152 [Amniculicola lignicola CBS 123094]|uniref:DUF7730 domain-containing protein n=1 Tax=Amniculicola lignicola CBS 123094 TaxID=1392246 RepID=A0A6A5WL48_9PLEO|nr:hypothetical protein P154DRAFT_522152 [Amniculicola lignicola CBS 123094]